MQKELLEVGMPVLTGSSLQEDNSTTIVVSSYQQEHKHGPHEKTGACRVSGCGCPEYKDNGGTCWNLNSAGGTCNHLASDH